jgi:hypothetical protein
MSPSRRDFLLVSGAALTSAARPFKEMLRNSANHAIPLYSDAALNLLAKRMRPLVGGFALRSDTRVVESLRTWLSSGVRLGQKRHKITLRDEDIYQFVSLRPNVHSFVVGVFDDKVLRDIVDHGTRKPRPFERWWKSQGPSMELAFGSFQWLRTIIPDYKKRVGFRLQEIYWMTIWERRGKVVMPIIRAGDEYVSFYRADPGLTDDALRSRLQDAPAIVPDPSIIFLDWHDVAVGFNLTNSLPYLRACYTATSFPSDVWARQAFLAEPQEPLSRAGTLVFTPSGVSGSTQQAWIYRVPPIGQQPEQVRKGVHHLSDLRVAPNGITVANFFPNRVVELQAQSADWEVAPVPSPKEFPDTSLAGVEYINYAQVMSRRAAQYLSNGHFAVRVAVPSQSAAQLGVRASSYSTEVETDPPTVSDRSEPSVASGDTLTPILSAVGNAVGNAVANYVDDQFGWSEKADKAYAEAVKAGETCAAKTGFKADCRYCVDSHGLDTYEEMTQRHQVVDGIVTSVAGALADCAVAGYFGGIYACAAAAVAGAIVNGAGAVSEWRDMEDEIASKKKNVYSPCEEKTI